MTRFARFVLYALPFYLLFLLILIAAKFIRDLK
jgi:hypothetical protein